MSKAVIANINEAQPHDLIEFTSENYGKGRRVRGSILAIEDGRVKVHVSRTSKPWLRISDMEINEIERLD